MTITIIKLNGIQMDVLRKLLEKHHKEGHKYECKIVFFPNEMIRVWSNRMGYSTNDLEDGN